MMKSFEDMQAFNKDSIEAFSASSAAMTKGYQAVAQEVADFSKKSFEKSAAVWQGAVAAKSFEKAVELQQSYAKESFEAALTEFTKLGELVASAAKGAYKPYEATFAAFGVKAPVTK
jgi:phasin family protein